MQDVVYFRRMASLRTAVAPIVDFLDDDNIVEIMLNPDGAVWVEESGRGMYRTSVVMDRDSAERLIRLAAAAMNFEINERRPFLSATLPGWKARLQASVPPIVSSPVFALRKPPSTVFTLQDYVERRVMTPAQASLLEQAVRRKRNIVIGGGTGSGKTTLGNALLQVVADTDDRVYLVEDSTELQCRAENMVQVLVQPPIYTHQQAIMDAMRFRPDRIIVGEVRDGAALELLKAWNTGHPGGIATIHANHAAAILDRFVQLCEEIVHAAPKYLIAEAVDICVHIQRDHHHPAGRVVSDICMVSGLDPRGGWLLEPIGEEACPESVHEYLSDLSPT